MVTALTILTLVALPSVYTSLEMTSSSSCSYLGQCSQICHASGCSCLEGFKLGTDNKSCIPVETRKILFADIAQLGYLDHFESFQPTVHILYPSNSYTSLDTVGITFDARNKHVYWTDRRSKNVYRTTLDKPGNPEVITDNSRLQSPEGIAFDWITGNVYFKDKVLGEIIVCRNDSRNKCGTILAEPQALRDLALHPNLGLMFWGKDAVLMRAGMDGSNPVPIVTLNIKSPGGIAVDQGNARIYWVDRNLDTVSSSDFNGKDVKLIIPNDENKSNLYLGIDILGDDIYWSELFDGRIETANKFTGSNRKTVRNDTDHYFTGISIFSVAKQPILRPNPCVNNGHCSDICVLSPVTVSPLGYSCLCPPKDASDIIWQVCNISQSFVGKDHAEPGATPHDISDHSTDGFTVGINREDMLTTVDSLETHHPVHILTTRATYFTQLPVTPTPNAMTTRSTQLKVHSTAKTMPTVKLSTSDVDDDVLNLFRNDWSTPTSNLAVAATKPGIRNNKYIASRSTIGPTGIILLIVSGILVLVLSGVAGMIVRKRRNNSGINERAFLRIREDHVEFI